MEKLFLHEELMLLSLKDKEGTIQFGAMYQYAIAGGVLAELILQKRLNVEKKGRRRKAQVVDETPFGDPFLDECLERISKNKRRIHLQNIVSKLSTIMKLKHKVAGALCNKGILREDEESILLLFSRKIYPEMNPEPERMINARMIQAIESDGEDVDARTAILISLAEGTGILKPAIGKEMWKRRKKRIKSIAKGDVIAESTHDAIQEIQAAIMVACIMPAVMVSTMGH